VILARKATLALALQGQLEYLVLLVQVAPREIPGRQGLKAILARREYLVLPALKVIPGRKAIREAAILVQLA
jgi:hypothetical protein